MYVVLSCVRDRVCLLSQNEQRKRQCVFFLVPFLDLPVLCLNEPQTWRPLTTTNTPAISIWATHPYALGSVVTGVIQLPSVSQPLIRTE